MKEPVHMADADGRYSCGLPDGHGKRTVLSHRVTCPLCRLALEAARALVDLP